MTREGVANTEASAVSKQDTVHAHQPRKYANWNAPWLRIASAEQHQDRFHEGPVLNYSHLVAQFLGRSHTCHLKSNRMTKLSQYRSTHKEVLGAPMGPACHSNTRYH